MAPPVLVIGMSRSGTTFAARVLASRPEVHLEMEPHVLWKAGSFHHLDDESYETDPAGLDWIRTRLLRAAAGRVLVDKSPANCLRPGLVHAAFPEARVVSIVRDPRAVVASNLAHSRIRHALDPRVVTRKYLAPRRSSQPAGIRFDRTVHAEGGRSLAGQLRARDLPAFTAYALRLTRLRRAGLVPFGPRLAGFAERTRHDGLLEYHVAQHRAGEHYRAEFAARYGRALETFRFEDLSNDPEEIDRLFSFVGLTPVAGDAAAIVEAVRARPAAAPGAGLAPDELDRITRLLDRNGSSA